MVSIIARIDSRLVMSTLMNSIRSVPNSVTRSAWTLLPEESSISAMTAVPPFSMTDLTKPLPTRPAPPVMTTILPSRSNRDFIEFHNPVFFLRKIRRDQHFHCAQNELWLDSRLPGPDHCDEIGQQPPEHGKIVIGFCVKAFLVAPEVELQSLR